MSRNARTDEDYANDSGLRLLKVLEALEGTSFESVSVQRVQNRTGFSYNFCFRALKTLKVAGFAQETESGWQVSSKLLKFSERFNDLCIASMAAKNSEISEFLD